MLKHYLRILIQYRKRFCGVVFVATLLGVIISILLPKWYLAETTFVTPELAPNSMIGMGGSLSSVIQSFTGQRKNNNGYNYQAILNSRTVNEAVIVKFGLMKVYKVKDSLMSKALKQLERNVTISLGENSETTISVYDRNPDRAAGIANFYVQLLNERGREFAQEELATFRRTVEARIQENETALFDLERKIRTFQEREKIPLAFSEDAAGLEFIGAIYAQRLNLEIQRDFLIENFGTEYPSIRSIDGQLRKLDEKIKSIPKMSVESLELYRQFIIRKKISEFIIPMLEQVKLSELQRIPNVVVIDKAVPPDRKSKPKRLFIILAVFLLSSVTTFVFILAQEKYNGEFHRILKQARTEWKR